jgi:hypothetical protein
MLTTVAGVGCAATCGIAVMPLRMMANPNLKKPLLNRCTMIFIVFENAGIVCHRMNV